MYNISSVYSFLLLCFCVFSTQLFLICDFVISTFVLLGGSGLRASIDSSRVLSNRPGMLPYREPAPNHRIRSSGVTPAPGPISEPPNPIREPLQPPLLLPYITLYPCPASSLSGAPRTGASNWGLRPEITMAAQC